MKPEVKRCLDAKFDVFDRYFTVPEDVAGEIGQLMREAAALGEECEDGVEFEEKFTSQKLADRYNAFFMRCTPKKVSMTAEEKKASVKMSGELMYGSKNPTVIAAGLAKDVLDDAAFHASVELEDDMLAKSRDAMIENGTYEGYKRVTDAVSTAEWAHGLLKGRFKKK